MNEEDQRKHAQWLMMHNPYLAEESEWAMVTITHTDLELWRLFLEYAKKAALTEVQWEAFYSDIVKQSRRIGIACKPGESVVLKVSITDAAWLIPILKAFIKVNREHTALKGYLDTLDKPNRKAFIDEIRRIYIYGWSLMKFTVKMQQGMA